MSDQSVAKDILANSQQYCEELRRIAPHHTHQNDREIIESERSCLNLDMQIPSYEEDWLIELIRFKIGVLKWQQMLMKMVTEAYPAAVGATTDPCPHQHPDRQPDDDYCRDCGEMFNR